jgi:transposase InsO family protein
VGRKKEVVLRLLRGEQVDAISREASVPIYKLERWRDRGLAGIDAGLKARENNPVGASSMRPTGASANWSLKYIEIFYNHIRKQARLGHLSPAAFSQQYYANQIAAYTVGLYDLQPTSNLTK